MDSDQGKTRNETTDAHFVEYWLNSIQDMQLDKDMKYLERYRILSNIYKDYAILESQQVGAKLQAS